MKNKQKKDVNEIATSIVNEVSEGNGATRNDHTPALKLIEEGMTKQGEIVLSDASIFADSLPPIQVAYVPDARYAAFIVEAVNSHEQLVANNERLESENARLVAENKALREAHAMEVRRGERLFKEKEALREAARTGLLLLSEYAAYNSDRTNEIDKRDSAAIIALEEALRPAKEGK